MRYTASTQGRACASQKIAYNNSAARHQSIKNKTIMSEHDHPLPSELLPEIRQRLKGYSVMLTANGNFSANQSSAVITLQDLVAVINVIMGDAQYLSRVVNKLTIENHRLTAELKAIKTKAKTK